LDPHGSLAISPKGGLIKAENEQARKPPAPYAALHGHPKFGIPAALPWPGRACGDARVALGTPCHLGDVGNTGERLGEARAGVWRKAGAFGCWESKLGGPNPELGQAAKQKHPAAWRLQAGNDKRTMSFCQVDQGHLQIKVSPYFFLPQPLHPTISVGSDSGTLGRTSSSQWSHLLPRFFTP